MTVEEIKAEAAKLSPDEQFSLVQWIEESGGIRELRRAALVREIEIGLDDLRKGDVVECNGDAELSSFLSDVKARGRKRMGLDKESAA